LDVSDDRKLKALQVENRKLTKLLADAMLGQRRSPRLVVKTLLRPAAKRQAIAYPRERTASLFADCGRPQDPCASFVGGGVDGVDDRGAL
jgi:hypothetical protein